MRSNPTNAAIEQNRTLMATLPVGKLDQVSRQRGIYYFLPFAGISLCRAFALPHGRKRRQRPGLRSEEEYGEHGGQVDERGDQETAGGLVVVAVGEPYRCGQVDRAQDKNCNVIRRAGQAELPRDLADQQEHHRAEYGQESGGLAGLVGYGGDPNAGGGELAAVEPGNRHRVRKLPEEDDAEEHEHQGEKAWPAAAAPRRTGIAPAAAPMGVCHGVRFFNGV